jgi:hypothetical protein
MEYLSSLMSQGRAYFHDLMKEPIAEVDQAIQDKIVAPVTSTRISFAMDEMANVGGNDIVLKKSTLGHAFMSDNYRTLEKVDQLWVELSKWGTSLEPGVITINKRNLKGVSAWLNGRVTTQAFDNMKDLTPVMVESIIDRLQTEDILDYKGHIISSPGTHKIESILVGEELKYASQISEMLRYYSEESYVSKLIHVDPEYSGQMTTDMFVSIPGITRSQSSNLINNLKFQGILGHNDRVMLMPTEESFDLDADGEPYKAQVFERIRIVYNQSARGLVNQVINNISRINRTKKSYLGAQNLLQFISSNQDYIFKLWLNKIEESADYQGDRVKSQPYSSVHLESMIPNLDEMFGRDLPQSMRDWLESSSTPTRSVSAMAYLRKIRNYPATKQSVERISEWLSNTKGLDLSDLEKAQLEWSTAGWMSSWLESAVDRDGKGLRLTNKEKRWLSKVRYTSNISSVPLQKNLTRKALKQLTVWLQEKHGVTLTRNELKIMRQSTPAWISAYLKSPVTRFKYPMNKDDIALMHSGNTTKVLEWLDVNRGIIFQEEERQLMIQSPERLIASLRRFSVSSGLGLTLNPELESWIASENQWISDPLNTQVNPPHIPLDERLSKDVKGRIMQTWLNRSKPTMSKRAAHNLTEGMIEVLSHQSTEKLISKSLAVFIKGSRILQNIRLVSDASNSAVVNNTSRVKHQVEAAQRLLVNSSFRQKVGKQVIQMANLEGQSEYMQRRFVVLLGDMNDPVFIRPLLALKSTNSPKSLLVATIDNSLKQLGYRDDQPRILASVYSSKNITETRPYSVPKQRSQRNSQKIPVPSIPVPQPLLKSFADKAASPSSFSIDVASTY